MKTLSDTAIVLSRVDYGERDRILTLLCAKAGKISVLAKGVRAQKSRLAGGIELLSETDITYIEGRSGLKPLTGARLKIHFSELAKDMRKMNRAFEFIKAINKVTEEDTGQDYYPVLHMALVSLKDSSCDSRLVNIWFCLQCLKLGGSEPNLQVSDEADEFEFNYDKQQFESRPGGAFTKSDLKLLRLCYAYPKPPKIENQLGSEDRLEVLAQTLLKSNLTEV